MLRCDNYVVVRGLVKFSMWGQVMGSLRYIAMLIAKNDIYLEPIWISTKTNQLADDLLRFRYRKIADIYPQLRHLTTIPPR